MGELHITLKSPKTMNSMHLYQRKIILMILFVLLMREGQVMVAF